MRNKISLFIALLLAFTAHGQTIYSFQNWADGGQFGKRIYLPHDSTDGTSDVIFIGGNILALGIDGHYHTISGGGDAQVQADYTQTDNTAVDYIKNKPPISAVGLNGQWLSILNRPAVVRQDSLPYLYPSWLGALSWQTLYQSPDSTTYGYHTLGFYDGRYGSSSSFDSLTSQGGGFHTLPYNDARYFKRGDTSTNLPSNVTTQASRQKLADSLADLLAAKFGLTDTGYARILASVYLLQKVTDSMKVVNDARYQQNFGGAPGQLQGTYASIPAATSYSTGMTYIAQDSGFQYVDTGSGGSRGWKKISGGSGSSFANPITSKGDVIAGTGSGAYTRQAAGPDGSVLTANSASSTGLSYVVQPVTYNVFNFGAHGDGQLATDAHMASGTNTIGSLQATFLSTDVGEDILIKGAGTGGLDTLTTITGFTDAHHITVAVNASTTASGIIKWGHDDTGPIQAAINAADANHGGEVIFPILKNHMYLIGGPLIHSDNLGLDPNSQLFFPSHDFPEHNDTAPIVIKITGQIKPTTEFSALDNDSSQLYNDGVILESILTANYGQGSVIGIAPASTFSGGGFSATTPLLENLFFRVPDGPHGAYRSGVDFGNAVGLQIKNCVAKSDVPYVVTHGPGTGMHTFGFRTTGINGGTEVFFDGVDMVGGFEAAYIISEHTIAFNLQGEACLIGIEQSKSNHIDHISTAKMQWCAHAVSADSGAAQIQIDQLDVEGLQSGKWYDYIDGINDPNGYLSGPVGYYFVASSISPSITWSVTGPSSVQSFKRNNPLANQITQIGGNTTTPVPVAGVMSTNNPFVEIYDGQTVSGNSHYPQVFISTNQQGTSNAIGDFGFLNRYTNDRLTLLECLTDGATNSANLTQYIANGGSLIAAQTILHDGTIEDNTYGSGTHTGTLTYLSGYTGSGKKIEVDPASIGGGGSGTFLPTAASVTNVSSVMSDSAVYTAKGRTVHVKYTGTVTPTSANITTFSLTLPFSTTRSQTVGMGSIIPSGNPILTEGYATTPSGSVVQFNFQSPGTGPYDFVFQIDYLIN